MTRNTVILTVSPNKVEEIERHLAEGMPFDGVRIGNIHHLKTAYFGTVIHNGVPCMLEADIKVVNGEPPYVDAVLFLAGSEIAVLEPVGDTFLGDYIFEHDGETYTVLVKKGG